MKYNGIITFDLDGTLLSTNSDAKNCYLKAFKKTFDIDNIKEPIFKGGIDQSILFNLCSSNGIKLDEFSKKLFIENYLKHLEDYSDFSSWYIFDFVLDFLQILKESGYLLVLVSGNFYETGIFKLNKSSLSTFFDYLSLNNHEMSRLDLMKKAIEFSIKINLKILAHFGDAITDITSSHFFNIPAFLFLPGMDLMNNTNLINDIVKHLKIENFQDYIQNFLNIYLVRQTDYLSYSNLSLTHELSTDKYQNSIMTSIHKNKENNLLFIFNSYKDIINNFNYLIKSKILEKGE